MSRILDLTSFQPPPSVVLHQHDDNNHQLYQWWQTNSYLIRKCVFAFFMGFLACLALLRILWLFFGDKLKDYITEKFQYQLPDGPFLFSSRLFSHTDLAFLEDEEQLTSLEVIGRGSCGKVYKKELPLNPNDPDKPSSIIAIKQIMRCNANRLEPLSLGDSRLLDRLALQVLSEIQAVSRICHHNLLPLLAHVARPNCHYLIYEYMQNGSLEGVLKNAAHGYLQVDWPTRYKIAVGISRGLVYLHHHHRPQIIHRDLKPGNILLDKDMEPKIADFGLAMLMPEAHTHMTSSNIAGTLGYIAPEYYQTFKYTAKCDVYSFGVILGALVIGKLPSDDFFHCTEEYSLVKWMRNVLSSENSFEAIDVKLEANGYEEQMLLVLKIACFCTADDPKERPDSNDVKCMLAQIHHVDC